MCNHLNSQQLQIEYYVDYLFHSPRGLEDRSTIGCVFQSIQVLAMPIIRTIISQDPLQSGRTLNCITPYPLTRSKWVSPQAPKGILIIWHSSPMEPQGDHKQTLVYIFQFVDPSYVVTECHVIMHVQCQLNYSWSVVACPSIVFAIAWLSLGWLQYHSLYSLLHGFHSGEFKISIGTTMVLL